MKKPILLAVALMTLNAVAQEGILPGEPDPNSAPGKEVIVKNPKNANDVKKDDVALIDDRKTCPKGQKRYQVYHCALESEPEQHCKNFNAIFECSHKPKTVKCEKPKVMKPLYHCEGS
jgi:hypothetical protein